MCLRKPFLAALAALAVFQQPAFAAVHDHHHDAPRPDDHAPIGVMGEHMHGAGEFMVSYRFMRMSMNGNRDGRSRVSAAGVLADPRFLVAPTDMDMEMHMLGAMWAPHDRITLTTMLPFLRVDMKHRTAMGARFTTRANGLGDVQLGALLRLFDDETHHLHLNAGVGLPTGRISAKDDTPAGRVRLPYPMQLGSGSYELIPGLTYSGRQGSWSWGGQFLLTYRVDENRKGYRWGHEWQSTAWLQRLLLPWLSGSLRLDYRDWNDIRGRDSDLALIVPTAFPGLRGGRRLDLLVGANFRVSRGPLRGHRFAIEAGRPLRQELDGPQLETDWSLTAGWQLAF